MIKKRFHKEASYLTSELREFKQYQAIMEWIFEQAPLMIEANTNFIKSQYPLTKDEFKDIQFAFYGASFEDIVYVSNVLILKTNIKLKKITTLQEVR